MTSQSMTPDLPYPLGVTGTQKPVDQPIEDWFRQAFANRGRLVELAVVRSGARHYSLSPTMQATGIAYAAWGVNGRVVAEIYPFHEAVESNDDTHNLFWQSRSEDDNPTLFDACPIEVLMQLTPAGNPEAYRWRRECARNYPPHVYPLLHEHLQLVFPREGTRWRWRTSVERYPHFIAEPGPPVVSWRDGDEAWEKCGLAGREGPGQGVESVALSYYIARGIGIDPPPGLAFSKQHLTIAKQASANMAAIREWLLERGVQGPSEQPGRLIPTGWGTYPLHNGMLVGSTRTQAELDLLLAHGFFADHPIRSASGATILTYRVIWKGRVEGHPAFGNYAIAEHNTESRQREILAIRDSFEQVREEFSIDLTAWYWIQVEGKWQEPT